MDETIPPSQYSGGALKAKNPFDFSGITPEATAAFVTALQEFSTSAAQAGMAFRRIQLNAPMRIAIWDSSKMEIEAEAVRPKPKRINMRGFSEVEL